jgi:hypothetical protein
VIGGWPEVCAGVEDACAADGASGKESVVAGSAKLKVAINKIAKLPATVRACRKMKRHREKEVELQLLLVIMTSYGCLSSGIAWLGQRELLVPLTWKHRQGRMLSIFW